MMCVDGMGHSELVGMFLITSETQVMIQVMLEIFRAGNEEASAAVKVFITDRGSVLRGAIRSVFADSYRQLCKFHILRSFRRGITVGQNLTEDQKERALHVLQSLVNAPDEVSYARLRKSPSPQCVREYFDTNWHPVRHEWVRGLTDGGLYGTFTIDQLENFNGKLKDVCRVHSSFPDFARVVTVLLFSQRRDHQFQTHNMWHKRLVCVHTGDMGVYQAHLTSFAFQAVKAQAKLMENVELDRVGDEFRCTTTSGCPITPCSTHCQCSFRRRYQLPCRHMLRVRQVLGLGLFENTLFSSRWHMGSQHVPVTRRDPTLTLQSAPRETRALTQHERYRRALAIANQIASVGSELTGNGFDAFTQALKDTLAILKQGRCMHLSSCTMQAVAMPISARMTSMQVLMLNWSHSLQILFQIKAWLEMSSPQDILARAQLEIPAPFPPQAFPGRVWLQKRAPSPQDLLARAQLEIPAPSPPQAAPGRVWLQRCAPFSPQEFLARVRPRRAARSLSLAVPNRSLLVPVLFMSQIETCGGDWGISPNRNI
ncbi:uncharacterized protein LOC119093726 [Pollicipes pollicipes]|uniref:uncharacterized protein LOC119093726 n=1 Tax=Pollicipes pollicipes TaxID=41117 RepID=UPI0018856D73|nr:uncharacterized protein LOC119093726 [Pollicipes pollicipes]